MPDGFPAAYEAVAQEVFANMQRDARVTYAQDVVDAVWRAATDPSAPMRIAAGEDAVALLPT